MSKDRPQVTVRRSDDGSLEIVDDGKPDPEHTPEIAPPPNKPDPAQDVPRDPNPYWGAG